MRLRKIISFPAQLILCIFPIHNVVFFPMTTSVTLRTSRGYTNLYEDDIPKPQGRITSDARTTKGLCRPKKNILFGQLNSRSLSSTSAKEELD